MIAATPAVTFVMYIGKQILLSVVTTVQRDNISIISTMEPVLIVVRRVLGFA